MRPIQDEYMIVDNFAGGGGASQGIKQATGRDPDAAINHDPEALAMHEANHPFTRHYATDVFDIDPVLVSRGRRIGLAWFSPDCTHHSKARGGKPIRPRGRKSRSLAWVVHKWASLPEKTRPRVIILENVEEFQEWGPVVKKVGTDGFPVLDADGQPWYVPCPKRRGKTFRFWVRKLQRLGYQVEWKELRACDYGAPTVRKRLFLIARCDGLPIVWPKPTHGKPTDPAVIAGKLKPWRTAAEIIDWSLPCPSIFLTPKEAKKINVKRPLAENTLKRIMAGVKRYVLETADPFIVCCNHGGNWFRGQGIDEPTWTQTCSRDAFGLVMPFGVPRYGERSGQAPRSFPLTRPAPTVVPTGNGVSIVTPYLSLGQHGGRNRSLDLPLHTITASEKDQNTIIAPLLAREFGNSVGSDIDSPAPTVMPGGGGKTSLVQAFLAQHNTGVVGHKARRPLSTITGRGTQQQVVQADLVAASCLAHLRSHAGNGDLRTPVNALCASANHVAHVMAFIQKYYGTGGQDADCRDPMHTVTSKARMGVVTIEGVDYQITDIGMRMLEPRELFRAQGFPDDYQIDVWCKNRRNKKGKPMKPGYLTKGAQVRMCGNSVSPPMAEALVRSNCSFLSIRRRTRERQLELAGV